jgi:hypothetical protein
LWSANQQLALGKSLLPITGGQVPGYPCSGVATRDPLAQTLLIEQGQFLKSMFVREQAFKLLPLLGGAQSRQYGNMVEDFQVMNALIQVVFYRKADPLGHGFLQLQVLLPQVQLAALVGNKSEHQDRYAEQDEND